MQIPEELRCCICLSVPERSILTGCPHRVCAACVCTGGLSACPVCRAELPPERETDEAFHRHVANSVIRCECGSVMPVLEAEHHTCHMTRKRKRPEALHPPTTRKPPVVPNRSTFACPLCPARNLTRQDLVEHCERAHAGVRGPIAAPCPICLSMPWSDPSYVCRDFLQHVRLRHRCDYAVLADFEADEESMLQRALSDSMRTAGFEEELEEDERIMARVLEESAREAERAAQARGEEESTGDASAMSGSASSSTSEEASGASGSDEAAWRGEAFADEEEEDDDGLTSESGSLAGAAGGVSAADEMVQTPQIVA